MENPSRLNLQTSDEVRKHGWQAESRDADGHMISCHAPLKADDQDIAEWIVECTSRGETVTFWPMDANIPTPQMLLKGDVEAEIASVVQSVNEWDDRTSPADYPEHLLITSEELADILRNFAVSIAAEGKA